MQRNYSNLAPIVLFAYRRPVHFRRCLDSLQKNLLANQSKLFVFVDAPQKNASAEDVAANAEVKKIIPEKQWCREVELIAHKEHQGLTKNVTQGIEQVLKEFDRVIVLEDDLVLSPGFLTYMNEALERYANEEKVMHINGYMNPLHLNLPDTFFFNVASSWGWSTWRRAWQCLNTDLYGIIEELQSRNLVSHFDLNNSGVFYPQLEANLQGKLQNWAIYWYASVYLKGGYCLTPGKSLVQNTGFDGTGEHCNQTKMFLIPELAKKIEVKSIPLVENQLVRKSMQRYYRYDGAGWQNRLQYHLQKAFNLIYRITPNFLKYIYRKFKKK